MKKSPLAFFMLLSVLWTDAVNRAVQKVVGWFGSHALKNPLPGDTRAFGASDLRQWALVFVMFIALLYIVANLFPTLTTALTTYNTSESTFGAILVTIVPILIGAAVLILAVTVFLSKLGETK